METPKAQYELLCAQACTLVQSVGEFIRHEIGRVSTEQVSDKSLNNLVSYVDRTAEQQLVAGLQQLLPHSQVLAEEGTTVAPTDSPYTWVIDPLDGTTNFVHQLPFFSISVALQRNDTLIMGIVYEVVRGELFCAWEGSAAYLNGRAIGVSATADLKDSLLATGFPYYQFAQADQYLASDLPKSHAELLPPAKEGRGEPQEDAACSTICVGSYSSSCSSSVPPAAGAHPRNHHDRQPVQRVRSNPAPSVRI